MSFLSVLGILVVPALVALVLYVLLIFVLLPLYRNHYQRYSQYLPLDGLSARTQSIGGGLKAWLFRLVLPASMRRDRETSRMEEGGDRVYAVGDDIDDDDEEEGFAEEEGERLVGFEFARPGGAQSR